jgi:hypothetical protein
VFGARGLADGTDAQAFPSILQEPSMERKSIKIDAETAEVWQAAEHRRASDLVALWSNTFHTSRAKAAENGDIVPAGRTVGQTGEA